MKTYDIVTGMSCTRSISSDELIVETRISRLGLMCLKEEKILCGFIKYNKEKYRFYKDLSDALSEEILKELIELEDFGI